MKLSIEEAKSKYRLIADWHTHTVHSKVGPYLHGKGTIKENALAAYDRGLSELAITDHGPSDLYGLDLGSVAAMRREIVEAEAEFPGLKILLGIEADITDSENGLDVTADEFSLFDFVNAGYHYVPKCRALANWAAFHLPLAAGAREALRAQNTARVIKALKSNDINILTHPGDKAFVDINAIAKACEETSTIVEINARHKHPNEEDLKIFASHDVKFAISSDAHKPGRVGSYAESLCLAISAGIDPERIVNIEQRGEQLE